MYLYSLTKEGWKKISLMDILESKVDIRIVYIGNLWKNLQIAMHLLTKGIHLITKENNHYVMYTLRILKARKNDVKEGWYNVIINGEKIPCYIHEHIKYNSLSPADVVYMFRLIRNRTKIGIGVSLKKKNDYEITAYILEKQIITQNTKILIKYISTANS